MSHKTNDLFHNFFFPYLMQDRAYPVDIDESLSTNEYVNKIGRVTKSVIDDVTAVETRVEKLEGDMPTSDEIIALADEVTKGHILKIKEINNQFVDYDGNTVSLSDIYDVFLKGAVVLQIDMTGISDEYDNINAICCEAIAPNDTNPDYKFVFSYSDLVYNIKATYVNTDGNIAILPYYTHELFDIDYRLKTRILRVDTATNKMYDGRNEYTLEKFYDEYIDKHNNIVVVLPEFGINRYFTVNSVVRDEETGTEVVRVIFNNMYTAGLTFIDWQEGSISIDNFPYGGSSLNHIHLYCDGEGICYFNQKDLPDIPYLTFNEIKAIIENDTNIVFITNGYYSFYSKYYYHTAISQQDTDAIGFIGETQLNGHAYSWRIAINEHNEVTEDEIRLASNSQIVEVENSIKDLVVYKNEEVFIGKWVDNKPIYRQVVTLTSGLAKDNPIQVIGNIPNFGKLMPTSGAVVTTTEGSSSSSDITMYATAAGAITVKQNFTSYPAQLDCIIEYTKNLDDDTAMLGVGALGRMILGNS